MGKHGSLIMDNWENKILNAYDDVKVENNTATFASGAKRSEQKLPFWKLSWRAKIEWAKRFAKGEKYDIQCGYSHNWKRAIGTGDVKFIQEFYNHCEEHLAKAKETLTHGVDYVDDEGEGVFDHLGAVIWNAAALIEYCEKDPENTRRALSQLPEEL